MSVRDAFGAEIEMDDVWTDAFAIAFGELAGGTWDWSNMEWESAR